MTDADKNDDVCSEEMLQRLAAAQMQQQEYRVLQQMQMQEQANEQRHRSQRLQNFLVGAPAGFWTKMPDMQFTPPQGERIKDVEVEIVEPKRLPPPDKGQSD